MESEGEMRPVLEAAGAVHALLFLMYANRTWRHGVIKVVYAKSGVSHLHGDIPVEGCVSGVFVGS